MTKMKIIVDDKVYWLGVLFDFPDGQPHVELSRMKVKNKKVIIKVRLTSPKDLFNLLLVHDVISNLNPKSIHLMIMYLMGSRMDRRISRYEPFTLDVVAKILNSMKFDSVNTFDAHSKITAKLINNSHNSIAMSTMREAVLSMVDSSKLKYSVLVSPDKGSRNRVNYAAKIISAKIVKCVKKRELKTGHLLGFKILNPELAKNRECLIIDDICDGGGTFIGIAELLRKAGAKKVNLYVTHGIFSKGFKLKGINEIYTTNSYRDDYPKYIHVKDVW